MAKDNYCIYCGFKLFPEDHFCPNCGKRLDEAEEKPKNDKKTTYSSSTARTPKKDYSSFKKQLDNLKETYEIKEEKVIELLEKKFPNGQMSYGRFRAEVDSCRVSFYREADAAENMIDLSDEYSDKIAEALNEKIKTLQSLIAKMGELQSELIISISNGDDDSTQEIDNLIKEMNDLIDSVKDYE